MKYLFTVILFTVCECLASGATTIKDLEGCGIISDYSLELECKKSVANTGSFEVDNEILKGEKPKPAPQNFKPIWGPGENPNQDTRTYEQKKLNTISTSLVVIATIATVGFVWGVVAIASN